MTASKIGDDSGTRKLGLSCAECRRSKLKCDRTFPCQSCIRRGCSGICPEGTLAATKGNKVLMAQAQRLNEEVKVLNARVYELEAALALAQVQPTRALTRMRSNASLHIKDEDIPGEEKSRELSASLGSLSLGIDGQAKFHGESAGSEYLQDLYGPSEEDIRNFKPASVPLPNEIVTLTQAFPFGLKDCPFNKSIFLPFVPSKQTATELASIYYRNVAWMYDPIPFDDFIASIINPIYGEHGYTSIDGIHSHRLSILFIILAHGRLYVPQLSAQVLAEQYHLLARAAISFDSILMEATCATVQALFLLFRFVYDADIVAKEERWLLTGVCVRIAHTIGLQRDGAAWDLGHDELQRRRSLYWELFVWESWSSLVHGRPGSLLIQHTDCKFSEDLAPSISASGEVEMGFHAWKFRYSATCLSISVEHVFSTKSPPYSAILKIEKKILQFPVPKHLRSCERVPESSSTWSTDARHALQQYCTLCVRESNLLYIHRSYFAQAIKDSPGEPLQHKYGRSVRATHESACRLIWSLRTLFPICPLVCRVWFFWSGIFSACVVLGILVVESPRCSLAKSALKELEAAIPFFEAGSRHCRPPSTLTFLQKVFQRALVSYETSKSGFDDSPNSSNKSNSKEPDELEVISGRKAVITTKSNSNSPSYVPREGPGGSSPPSHSIAAESLIALRNQLDGSSLIAPESQDIEIEVAQQTSPFQSPTHPRMMEMEQSSPVMDTFLMNVSETSPHAEILSRKCERGPWQQVHTDHHSNVLPSFGSPTRGYVSYEDSPPMRDFSHATLPHSPTFPAPVTQDEIWRHFMLHFNNGQ